MGNSVTVARQTLTLFVGVRIPIPQPEKSSISTEMLLFCLCKIRIGIRTAKGIRRKANKLSCGEFAESQRAQARR